MSVTGTVSVQQSISGSSTWVGPGQFNWISGIVSNVTFGPNLTAQLSTSGLKFVNGNCTNQGTMIWTAGGDFLINTNAHFFNTGLFQLENNCLIGNVAANFENDGTVYVPPGLGGLSLTINCFFLNLGTIDVETNSTLDITTGGLGSLVLSHGTVFDGAGTVALNSSVPIGSFPQITANGTVEFNSTLGPIAGNTVWAGSGVLQFMGGTMSNVTFAPGFNVQLLGSDSKTLNGACTNQGTILYLGTGNLRTDWVQPGQFYNAGILLIETNCEIDTFTNFQNTGTITVPTGLGALSLTNTCNFTNYATIDIESNSILTIVTPNLSPTVPSQGTTAFESGTVFAGAGTIQFGPIGTLNCDGTITVDGTLILTYVTQAGNATWTGPGLLQLADGAWMTNVTFAPGFNVQTLGSDYKIFDGTCTNQGTIRVLGTGGLDAPYGGQFFNTGLLQIETNCILSIPSFGSFSSAFQNTGTIKIPPGLGLLSLTTVYPFTNYGVIDVETNSSLVFSNSPGFNQQPIFDFESGTVFGGAGTVELVSVVPLYCHGTITVDGTTIFNTLQNGNVIWTGPGLLKFLDGEMTDATFAPGFNVQLLGPDFIGFDGPCTNQGTIRVLFSGGIDGFDGGPFYNNGLFQIESNFYDLYGFTGFRNTGTIRVPPGLGVLPLTIDCVFTNSGVIDVETNSELVISNTGFISGSQTYLDGTTFAGPGTVRFCPGENLTSYGTITVDGTIIFDSDQFGSGVSQSGNVIWTGPGLLQFLGGTMTDVTFAPGFNVQMLNALFSPLSFEGACTNQGTIRVLGNGSLDAPDGGSFYNSGVFQIETNFYDLYRFSGFQNAGTIRVPPGLGTIPLTIDCAFTNSGVIDVKTNSELVISNGNSMILGDGSETYLGGTTFDGSGTVSLIESGNGGIKCCGSITDNCALNLQSDMFGASTWTGSGRFGWLSGAINNITFAPAFHAQISGPNSKFLTGVCTNQGTVCWLGGGQLNDSMTGGQFFNSGILQVSADGIWNNIPINNEAGGTFRQLAGTFAIPSFTNMGAVQAVSGLLNVATDFDSTSGSSYHVTVNGTTPGTNFNQLNAQNLALNGSLQVVLTNGFSPSLGNSFSIMTGARSGSFSSTALPAPQSNLMWGVQYAPASVVLEVGQPGGALTNMSFVNGTFQFSLNGFPSGSYDIQASSNLIDWTTIATNYPFSGSITVTDTNAAEFGNRFYRARMFP
jgi:hypothetical protein